MKKKQQKKTSTEALIVIVIVALAIVGYVLFVKESTPSYVPAMQQQDQPAAIQNDSELENVSNDLENTNIDSMDSELDQNDSDASSF